MNLKTIGQRIFKARHDKKMSQLKLADYTNLSQAIITAYEQDMLVPSEITLNIIAKHLDVKVSWLMYGDGNNKKLK